ncbi:hypothetical protein E6C67_14345 [Azospirillum sp. TSA2s]|uniref:hypothetical protein n=1 Tax=Azospirillum sp. TSA2s TaxID=709810 RepID=UPI0010AA184D|nr:hypothetical protein [Azospirillum sp. TSA2s]QCG95006.1 hypothetical protein E6C67_14345 [Azospirillum sp. TSA2s]
MTDNLPARVAALELLVEQLIYERVMMTDSPDTAVRTAMGMLTQMASERPGVPPAAVGALADVLAQVMMRLEESR